MERIIFLTPEINIATGTLRVVNLWANFLSMNSQYKVTIVTNSKEKPYYEFDSDVYIEKFNFNFNFKIINIPYNIIQLYRYLKSLKRENNIHLIIDKSLLIEPIWILKKVGLFKNINFIYNLDNMLSRVATQLQSKFRF